MEQFPPGVWCLRSFFMTQRLNATDFGLLSGTKNRRCIISGKNYFLIFILINHKSIQMNILIKGKCTSSYDEVYEDFLKGSETRSQCCDESKTTISKIDNKNFVVLMFDVDMPKLKELLSTPERAEVIKKNGLSNKMFQFSPLG